MEGPVGDGASYAREEAAHAVGGTALFPIFAPGENAYPAELAPMTPPRYRAHLRATQRLEDAQQDPERVKLTFVSPAYSLLDLWRFVRGAKVSFEQLWREFFAVDLAR